jgi:predicted DNA-binding protein
MSENQRDMVRVNTRISSEVNDWLDAKSKKTGVPKSAIIHLALEQYIMQIRSVDALELSQGTLKELFDKVNQIEKKLSSGDVVKS